MKQEFGITITPCANGYTVQLPEENPADQFGEKMSKLMEGILSKLQDDPDSLKSMQAGFEDHSIQELIDTAGKPLTRNSSIYVFPSLKEALEFISDRID